MHHHPSFLGLLGSYKLAEHMVIEVAAEPFKGLSLTLGSAVAGRLSSSGCCDNVPSLTPPGRVSDRAK